MSCLNITIEDHVVPQLLTSALEAYEIGDWSRRGNHQYDKLETFGLLWGYVVSERTSFNPRIIVTTSTVETSALRKNGSVTPDLESLIMKRDFFAKYWPHLEVVGCFHSHPYETLQKVKECKGWRASTPADFNHKQEGDTVFWPWFHEQICPETPYLSHIIVTVTALQKSAWAMPKRIENNSGFELGSDRRKLWITSYGTELNSLANTYDMYNCVSLDIPSLENRFI